MNKNALYYLERLDAFPIMETHIVDRVMQEYWQGNLDSNGKALDTSTPYNILTQSDQSYDFEHANRFYNRNKIRASPHPLNFMVVRGSMQMRYFMDMIFFFALTIYFQYELMDWLDVFNRMRNSYIAF